MADLGAVLPVAVLSYAADLEQEVQQLGDYILFHKRLLPKPISRPLLASAAAHERFRQTVRRASCVFLIAEPIELESDPQVAYILGICNGTQKDVHLVSGAHKSAWPPRVLQSVASLLPWPRSVRPSVGSMSGIGVSSAVA